MNVQPRRQIKTASESLASGETEEALIPVLPHAALKPTLQREVSDITIEGIPLLTDVSLTNDDASFRIRGADHEQTTDRPLKWVDPLIIAVEGFVAASFLTEQWWMLHGVSLIFLYIYASVALQWIRYMVNSALPRSV